jgi:hypothetical protein
MYTLGFVHVLYLACHIKGRLRVYGNRELRKISGYNRRLKKTA